MAPLTGVGGGNLDERHLRQVGFVFDALGDAAQRSMLQYPVEPPLGCSPFPFAPPGHPVQGQLLDSDEVVPTHELGAELMREILTHTHLFGGQASGGSLVRLIAFRLPETPALPSGDHLGLGHPALMKLALLAQLGSVGGIVEPAAIIGGGVHHAPVNADHPTRADLSGDR